MPGAGPRPVTDAILSGLLLLIIAVVGLWGARVRRRRRHAYVAVAAALVLLAGVLVPQLSLFRLEVRTLDAVLAVAAGVFLVDIVGLPRPLARRLGLGLYSREWRYDGDLVRLFAPLNDRLEMEPPMTEGELHDSWRLATLQEGGATLRRASRLRAPDGDWAALTDRYMETYASILDIVAHGDPGGRRAAVAAANEQLNDTRERLRSRYRTEGRDRGDQ